MTCPSEKVRPGRRSVSAEVEAPGTPERNGASGWPGSFRSMTDCDSHRLPIDADGRSRELHQPTAPWEIPVHCDSSKVFLHVGLDHIHGEALVGSTDLSGNQVGPDVKAVLGNRVEDPGRDDIGESPIDSKPAATPISVLIGPG